MGIFSRFFPKIKNESEEGVQVDDVLLRAFLNGEPITRDKAMTLPAVSSAVDLISGIIASMPIRLYKRRQGRIQAGAGDTRTRVLNGDTGDVLTGYQLKKNLVADYLMSRGGYAVIHKSQGMIDGLYYVKPEEVTGYKSDDHVFKKIRFQIDGKNYYDHQVFKLLRNSTNGINGKGLTEEVAKALETAYTTLVYQLGLVKSGGAKKGFLQSENRLEQEAINTLKDAWRNLYTSEGNNVVVLNKGVKFQEASSSSTEMQLNENKNTLTREINSIFHIQQGWTDTIKQAIYPIIKALESECDRVLLKQTEKSYMFFECDTKEILRASVSERYEAYSRALKDGWKTINEIRREENMNDISGMDVLNIGLSAVLYDVNTGVFFTPNTGTAMTTEEARVDDTSSQGEGGIAENE